MRKKQSTSSDSEKWTWVLSAITLILLVALLYFVRDNLSPLILFGISFLFLFVFRNFPIVRSLKWIFLLLFIFWFVDEAGSILAPFFLSFVFAYIFDPLVDQIQRLKIPRILAILIIVILIIGLIISALTFLIPVLVQQTGDLLQQTINYAPKVKSWFQTDVMNFLAKLNIDVERIKQVLSEELPKRLQNILSTFFQGVLNITTGVGTLISHILNLVLIPILTFYFLKDFDTIVARIGSLIPSEKRPLVTEYAQKINHALSGFLRGQLTVCLIVAVLTTLGLFVFGVKYALIIGIIAGILNIVPYVGLLVSLGLALIVGLFSPEPILSCLKILAVFGMVQSLEGTVISPKIVGESVGLHPVWVIFSILVFSQFWGFVGLLIAVPTASIVKVVIQNWYLSKWS